jgi:hypothetical protein
MNRASWRTKPVGVFVIFPVDVNRVRMTGSQTQGDLITEIRRKAGAGDAGDFGIFERVAGQRLPSGGQSENKISSASAATRGLCGYARRYSTIS